MSKIPKKAKRIFNGTVFDVYQWKQKMFDGSFKTFEMAKKLDTISVIATVGDKIAVLYQQQPGTEWYYTLPGGYVDVPGETARTAALRELLEETGLKPKRIKLWRTNNAHSRMTSNHYFFIAQDCEKVSDQEVDGGEKIKVLMKTFEQFLKYADIRSFHNQGLIIEMLRARLYPKEKAKLKKEIFG
ncbi:MAG TPA: NUDIX hydrolase [Patescibacteria group bacterium]|jgi:ADP-ribose pyrophosphatase YjhB (NUDIX family)|nr:NUDIX hydrolase [Patescibacteria group bacterium]